MASIIVITGPQEGDYYPLGHRTNVIGRDEALPIQILDERVSRKHMRICFDKDKNQYSAIDMNSKHGVFLLFLREKHRIEKLDTSDNEQKQSIPTTGQ